ncbi:MAG: hypothetical protein AAF702_11120 [Chloroflexota bacterium]
MTGLEALEAVQYVTVNQRRLAVVDVEAWESLLEWLETVDDIRAFRDAYEQLDEVDGDRAKAGWLKWDDVKE